MRKGTKVYNTKTFRTTPNTQRILDSTNKPKGYRGKPREKFAGGLAKKDNRLVIRERRKAVLSDILQGENFTEITKKYAEIYNITRRVVNEDIKALKKFIQDQLAENLHSVLPLHIRRYDFFYKKFRELGMDRLAMLANRRKEQMLNIYEDVHEIDIQNNLIVEETSDYDTGYDFTYDREDSTLTLKQQRRLKELLRKAKVKKNGKRSITSFGF